MVADIVWTILTSQLFIHIFHVDAFLNSGKVSTTGRQDPLCDQMSHRLTTLEDQMSHRLTTLEDRLRDKDTQITTLQSQVALLPASTTSLTDRLSDVEAKLKGSQAEFNVTIAKVAALERESHYGINKGWGALYTRWGRSSCPANGTELVYSGFAGGSYLTHVGAAANPVCLPRDPTWNKYDDTVNNWGLMYGAEYEYFGSETPSNDMVNHKVPCAVCRSTARTTTMMLPGRHVCYTGWHQEYSGYIMAGSHTHAAASEYVCVDESPETLTGDRNNDNGKLFYSVEGICGSLPCPPYVNGREITCAVCTK